MRGLWMFSGLLACGVATAQAPLEQPVQLVREVVNNELHDHERHGYWRYWIAQRTQKQNQVEEQIETADGPVTRVVSSEGRTLTGEAERREESRMAALLASPEEQDKHRQDYAADEKRIGRIVAMLPEAFVFEYAGEEGDCVRLRLRPNSAYPPRSIEARVFHAMSGDLWIDKKWKRLARLNGQLQENVDCGYGLLGRLYKGGWFQLQRKQVSPTDWKTERLEIHMSGRALLFKTIARETNEERGGLVALQAGMSLAQGVQWLSTQQQTATSLTPASLHGQH